MRVRALLAVAALLAVGACADDAQHTSGTSIGPAVSSTGPSSTATTVATAIPRGPACGAPTELVAGTNERTLVSEGLDRAYLLWVPEGYTGDEPVPVVFTFHGRSSNKEQQIIYSAFGPRAQEVGALVVAPDAVGSPRQWSPNGAMTEADDLLFVDDLLADLEQIACIDTTRLWAAGMSSGGFMTSNLACQRPDTFAAFGPVTFTLYAEGMCRDAPPQPIIAFHGTDDGVVPFEGRNGRGIEEVMGDWATHNGCDPDPTDERIGTEVIRRHWSACEATTELYIVEGGGHTWPGAIDFGPLGYTTKDISATAILWDLFLANANSPEG